MSSASYNRKSQDFTKIDNHASYSQDFYSQNGSVHHGNSFENYNTQKMTPNGGKTIILGDGATLTPKGGVTPGNGQEIRVLTVEKAGFKISDLQQPPKQIEKNDEGSRSRSRENSRKFVDENKLRDPLLGNGLESAKTTIIMAESSDPVSRQIDEFIRDLPQKKDWSHLKEILRKRLANVRPRNVKKFLVKLKTMLTDVDGVSTNIMEEKIDIFFFEKPFFSVMKEIATCESSILNFIRDVTWAPLTFFVVDMFLSPAQSCFISQTATQTILSMLTMALTAVVYRLVKNKFDPVDPSEAEPWHITLAKTIFVWLGAGLAIPGWNALQVVGENAGLWVGLSSNAAGFFSGMFPGIPEGPIQGIMSIISANTINRTWGEFDFLIFLKQVLIFGTFGAVPGDIWQFAYQAITDGIAAYGDMQPWAIVLVLGIGLATAVYIGNVGFGTFYERVINESHLIIELEVIEDSVDLTEDIIDKHHGHIVSYNGRAGAPNEEDIIIVKHDPHGNHFDHHGHHHDHLHEHHHHEQHLEQNHAEANEIHSYL